MTRISPTAPARGRFITLEGSEGVGKSTQLEAVAALLRAAGLVVVTTREPGGTERAERIREVLLAREGDPLPDVAELLLMFAARATHVANCIEPALARGEWVVCDRFTDATRAYQGGGRGVDRARIETLADWVHPGLQPDCTLLLDAPVHVGLARARLRAGTGPGPDRFESETLAFFERVRASYLTLAAAQPQRFAIIDATGDAEAVGRAVAGALRSRFAELARGEEP